MKMIRKYVADDGLEYLTAEAAWNADRRHRFGRIYDQNPLWLTVEDGRSLMVPAEAVAAWLEGNPEAGRALVPWLATKDD